MRSVLSRNVNIRFGLGGTFNYKGGDMVQRLNISIPDGLGERLEKHKDKMNVSRICQEALTMAIKMEELKAMTDDERAQMIERLKNEKEQALAEDGQAGKEQGIKDAKNGMDYRTFKVVQRVSELIQGHDYQFINAKDVVPEDVLEVWFQGDEDEVALEGLEDSGVDVDVYLRGWLNGVMEVWDQVEDQI